MLASQGENAPENLVRSVITIYEEEIRKTGLKTGVLPSRSHPNGIAEVFAHPLLSAKRSVRTDGDVPRSRRIPLPRVQERLDFTRKNQRALFQVLRQTRGLRANSLPVAVGQPLQGCGQFLSARIHGNTRNLVAVSRQSNTPPEERNHRLPTAQRWSPFMGVLVLRRLPACQYVNVGHHRYFFASASVASAASSCCSLTIRVLMPPAASGRAFAGCCLRLRLLVAR